MTIETINLGNQVNDGLGDNLREAFRKVNANFSSLASELTLTGINVGTSGYGIFKQKNGAAFEFKNITDGRYISLTEFSDSISIASTAPDATFTPPLDTTPSLLATPTDPDTTPPDPLATDTVTFAVELVARLLKRSRI